MFLGGEEVLDEGDSGGADAVAVVVVFTNHAPVTLIGVFAGVAPRPEVGAGEGGELGELVEAGDLASIVVGHDTTR